MREMDYSIIRQSMGRIWKNGQNSSQAYTRNIHIPDQ